MLERCTTVSTVSPGSRISRVVVDLVALTSNSSSLNCRKHTTIWVQFLELTTGRLQWPAKIPKTQATRVTNRLLAEVNPCYFRANKWLALEPHAVASGSVLREPTAGRFC